MGSNALFTEDELDLIRSQPALPPPPGVASNFDNPLNNNKLAIAVIAVCMALTAFFVLIRAYTRIRYMKRVKLEDYIGLVALPFFIAGTWILGSIPRDPGFLVHQWDIRVGDLEGFIYDYVLITILYCVALMLIKASILLEWVHLFVGTSGTAFYWICHVMIWSNCCLYVTTIITINFTCSPRERIWRRYIPGTCINIDAFNLFITAFHLVFDLLMLLLPHRVIWKLSLSTQQKIGISTVFSVGVVTCACAAGRVVSAVMMGSSPDSTYAYSRHLLWGLAEITTTELIFCVPAAPLMLRYPSLLHRIHEFLQSKMPTLSPRENISSNSSQHRTQPKASRREAPINEYPWMDENSDGHLTELELVRSRDGHAKNPYQEQSEQFQRGILRTTEIAITTSEDSEFGGEDVQKPKHPQAWLDC